MANESYGIYLRSYCSPGHGYGRLAVELSRHLLKYGVRLRISHLGQDISRRDIPDDLLPYVINGESPWKWEILVCPPDFKVNPGKRAVYITMWESTRLHHAWVDQFNRCDAVIVPSEFCHTIFDASGVNCPIYKVPLGVDTSVFKPASERNSRIVFGASGRTHMLGASVRKSISTILEAFDAAFPDDDEVALEVKLSSKCTAPETNDPRIRFFCEDWSERKLSQWYASLTAFVNTSHAEAFGLQMLEAAACGTPIISPLWSGQTEYLNATNCLVVPHEIVPASGIYAGLGNWCDVNFWGLVDQLKVAAGGGSIMTRIAMEGYRTAQRLTWHETCGQIHRILTEVGVFTEPKPTLPSGVPIAWLSGTEPVKEDDEFAEAFGIGKAQRRPMPEIPINREVHDGNTVAVVGPSPQGCGVGQYASDVALALGVRFHQYGDPYSADQNEHIILLHHHRHYWEKLPINKLIYDMYSAGHEIVLDIHDPAGIEELPGYVSKVIYHTPAFEGYIEKALPDAERHLIPLMCPEFPEGGMPLLGDPEPDIFYIGFHGLWTSHKGFELILGALRILQDRGAPFGVIGFGNLSDIDHAARERSQKYFDEIVKGRDVLKLKDCHIEARDFSPADILATLKQCACFVLPYTVRTIGQSSAVTGVMQPGKPIIVSNVPMFADVVNTVAKPLDELSSEAIANTVHHMFLVDECGRDLWANRAQCEYERRKPSVIAERYLEVIFGNDTKTLTSVAYK